MSAPAPVRVLGVSKKFTRTLKKSMYYGMADIAREFLGRRLGAERLREDEFWAVDDVNFEIEPGECLGLIGPNGAGKSTLLKMLNGIFMPDRGRIEIMGRVGALIELGAGFHPLLTGRENIYINGAILGLAKKEIDRKLDSIIDFSELDEFIDTPVKFYSSGMYVRLGFAVAAHTEPQVLLLDEVLAVGDVAFQAKCFNHVGKIRENGAALVLVSHNMHRIAGFCDRTAYLRKGAIAYLGDTGEAIARFTSDSMNRPDARTSEDEVQAQGTGKVKLIEVEFLDQAGNPIDSIRTGDFLKVRIAYQCEQDVENPLLDVAIRDGGTGTLFQASNRDFGCEFGKLGPRGRLEVDFASINVNNRMVDFFFALWSSSHNELYDWKRHLKLRIEGNPLSSGRIMLDSRWQNIPAKE